VEKGRKNPQKSAKTLGKGLAPSGIF